MASGKQYVRKQYEKHHTNHCIWCNMALNPALLDHYETTIRGQYIHFGCEKEPQALIRHGMQDYAKVK